MFNKNIMLREQIALKKNIDISTVLKHACKTLSKRVGMLSAGASVPAAESPHTCPTEEKKTYER